MGTRQAKQVRKELRQHYAHTYEEIVSLTRALDFKHRLIFMWRVWIKWELVWWRQFLLTVPLILWTVLPLIVYLLCR